MGALSIWHILIIAVVLVLLFGRGKISDIMGDTAKGIREFRKGLADPDKPPQGGNPADPASKDTAAHS